MEADKLSSMYKKINVDSFPARIEIHFLDENKKQTLLYEKVEWVLGGEKRGLRYGENPDQEAGLYKLVNGNLMLGKVTSIRPGKYLASDIELLQSGKHPGKINITDVDTALNILRYFTETPCTVIVKHNNPSGVARGDTLAESYYKAYMADRIAAFGGAIVVNRELDKETAELIADSYSEVVAAPEFSGEVVELLSKKKDLRVMKIGNIEKLFDFVGERVVDAKSLIDGGIIFQWSFVPKVRKKSDFLPAKTEYQGQEYTVHRQPTEEEYEDMLFGWLVESGITSNSVIYVKNG
ncbi:MAG: IMP cyclohydrolase, partial [Spirochaetota bacterium]